MPQIKNNEEVGNLIKAYLVKEEMSVEALALELKISKTALSKALDGKSVIDQERLKKIGEILKISKEELIQYDDEYENKSTFESIAEEGIKALGPILEVLNISKKDIYGKYLIEYVMKKNDTVTFKELYEKYQKCFSKVKLDSIILEDVILFMLKNKIQPVNEFIEAYTEVKYGFSLPEGSKRQKIFEEINKLNDGELYEYLLTGEIKVDSKLFGLINLKKKINPLSKRAIIDLIGEYKLDNMLEYFLAKITDFKYSLYSFIKSNYLTGVKFILEKNPNQDYIAQLNMHEYYLACCLSKDLDIIKYFLSKKYNFNLQELVIYALLNDFEAGYNYLYDNFHNDLYYREIVCVISEISNLDFLKRIRKELTADELDLALGLADEQDIEYMLYLIKEKAKFEPQYYNEAFCSKMNNLIKYYEERK